MLIPLQNRSKKYNFKNQMQIIKTKLQNSNLCKHDFDKFL